MERGQRYMRNPFRLDETPEVAKRCLKPYLGQSNSFTCSDLPDDYKNRFSHSFTRQPSEGM